jgi:hypothetical protein
MYCIENIVYQADDGATKLGMHLTDSQIKSALNKVTKLLLGRKIEIPASSQKEKIIAKLIDSIYWARENYTEQRWDWHGEIVEKPLSRAEWLKTIEAVESSIKIMKSHEPGSRRYIEHMRAFMSKALANKKPQDNDLIEPDEGEKVE